MVFGAGRSGQKLAPLGWVEGHRRVWTVSQSVSQINSGVNILRDLNGLANQSVSQSDKQRGKYIERLKLIGQSVSQSDTHGVNNPVGPISQSVKWSNSRVNNQSIMDVTSE